MSRHNGERWDRNRTRQTPTGCPASGSAPSTCTPGSGWLPLSTTDGASIPVPLSRTETGEPGAAGFEQEFSEPSWLKTVGEVAQSVLFLRQCGGVVLLRWNRPLLIAVAPIVCFAVTPPGPVACIVTLPA